MDAPSHIAIAICADDYGLHHGVNEAVQRLAGRRITAVSCMVGAPAWQQGIAALRALDPGRIDIGLHLDLTEYPLCLPPQSLPRLIATSYARLLKPAQVAAEIDAQIDAFVQALGRAPDHVDGHQHIHQLPGIRTPLVAALQRRFPNARPWLRSTRRPTLPAATARRKAWLIERLGERSLRRLAERYGYPQNHAFLGIYGFDGAAAAYAQHLAGWLQHARSGDLLMCHPAAPVSSAASAVTADRAPVDAILAARHHEFAVLDDPRFDQLLASHRITLDTLTRIQR
ncbi:MAG: ChbG/HpnK family deacetylase [Burkholderiaceae bacterium]|nr:ChbG/HpnK family deacetylase [Burkholderiaceae bacterium]